MLIRRSQMRMRRVVIHVDKGECTRFLQFVLLMSCSTDLLTCHIAGDHVDVSLLPTNTPYHQGG